MAAPRGEKWPVAALLAVVVCALLFYPAQRLNHDSSWFLVATRKFFGGEQLYVDILETNPPLAFFLTEPALYLADLTGLSEASAFALTVILAAWLSGLSTIALLRRASITPGERAALLMAGLAILFLLPLGEFGQREHLFLIFAMPYVLAAGLGRERLGLSPGAEIAIGLWAFLGVGLKPYFVLVPLAMTLAGPPRRLPHRIIALPNFALGLALLAYAGLSYLAFPVYFERLLPLLLEVYAGIGDDAATVWRRPEIVGLGLAALLCRRERAWQDGASLRFLAAALGGAAVYLVQFKGWNYQILPMSGLMVLATLWLVAERRLFARRAGLSLGLAAAVLVATLGTQIALGPYRSLTADHFARFSHGPGESVLVLSTNLSAAFPFVNEVRATWASRYPLQWQIPGPVRALRDTDCVAAPRACARSRAILDDARAAIVADIARYRPDLVFIDERTKKSYFAGARFDYLAFLSRDARFARDWRAYRKVGAVPGYSVWQRAGT
ncbi:hypothetical protein B2G71_20845 [Novosphingobium sp. PC22D]|uniref:hypothetical protein n=1 Tax=Novosphingobium sp. PC22D TaxID=1962403 RepID=UPI000BF02CA2|nr:hypothetical protein [Novosphingobium sp. PC22D]PEQ10756.1 hypothetical protein B2G71_20845 [Novosphingobium sp. PC22D]